MEYDRLDPEYTIPVVLDILSCLDAAGMAIDDVQLFDYVDAEALAHLISSLEPPYSITFSVADVPLVITEDGVELLNDPVTP